MPDILPVGPSIPRPFSVQACNPFPSFSASFILWSKIDCNLIWRIITSWMWMFWIKGIKGADWIGMGWVWSGSLEHAGGDATFHIAGLGQWYCKLGGLGWCWLLFAPAHRSNMIQCCAMCRAVARDLFPQMLQTSANCAATWSDLSMTLQQLQSVDGSSP